MTRLKKHKYFVRLISFLIIFSLIFQAGPVMALESIKIVSDVHRQPESATATVMEAEQQQTQDPAAETSAIPSEKQPQENTGESADATAGSQQEESPALPGNEDARQQSDVLLESDDIASSAFDPEKDAMLNDAMKIGDTIVENATPERNVVGELTEKREANVKNFQNDDNTVTAVVYDYDVHYKDENNQFVDIDNSLSTSKNKDGMAVLTNKSNVLNIDLAKNAGDGNLASLDYRGYSLSWSLNGAKKTQALDLSTNNEETVKDARELAIESSKKKTSQELILAATENVDSALMYKEVQKAVDLQYNLKGTTLKESIILNEKPAVSKFEFVFQTGKLTAKQEDEYIVFSTDSGEAIYYMQPFYMFDSADGYSTDIEIGWELINSREEGNQYLLTIAPSQEWLSSPDRVYPVTIDPTISTEQTYQNIYDTYVCSSYPTSNYTGSDTIRIGQSGSTVYRGFIRFSLPSSLKGSDRVVAAELALYPNASDFPTMAANGAPVMELHDPVAAWQSSTITWNNMPACDPQVIDYERIAAKDGQSATRWYQWDITRLVDKWYTVPNTNQGVMIKYNSETAYGNNMAAYFRSSESSVSAGFPIVYITYLNALGLEDYWTYHSYDAGLAGTGHVNDFTGEVTAVFTDAYLDSDRMPMELSHVHSSSNRSKVQSTLDVGKGWKLNIQQSVAPVTLGGMQKYKYIDADGTEHYFEQSGSNWVDDAGLDLKLTIGSSTYTITNKKDFIWTFNKANGYLTQMKDSNGNTVTINYSGGKITSMVDCSGRTFTFTSSGGRLQNVRLNDTRVVSYTYDSGGRLTGVTHPGESVVNGGGTNSVPNHATYYYDNDYLTRMLDDTTGNSTRYHHTHNYDTDIARVYHVYRAVSTLGNYTQEYDIAYTNHTTTFTETRPNQGRWEKYIFNTMGQTINAQDQDGHAIFYRLGASGGAKNKITFASKVEKTVLNLLKNHSFELDSNQSTTIQNYTVQKDSGSDVVYVTTANPFIGQMSLRVNKATGGSIPTGVSQSVTLEGGKKYTLSAYVLTDAASSSFANAGATLILEVPSHPSLTVKREGLFSTGKYTRYAATVDLSGVSGPVTVNAKMGYVNGSGIAYFDCAQLEEGDAANRYNLLRNPGLESPVSEWGGNYLVSGVDGCVTNIKKSGGYSYHIVGNPNVNKYLHQTVPVNGKAGEGLVGGVWVKTNGVPNKDTYGDGTKQSVGITMALKKADGSGYQYRSILFSPTSEEWQYVCVEAIADANYSEVTIYLKFTRQYNDVYFDEAQLYKDNFGQSFNYDAKGNVISVVDMAQNTETVTVTGNNDLSTYRDGKNGLYTFEYDNGSTTTKKHNLTQVKAPDESYTRMAYSSTGQHTYTTVYAKGYVADPNNANKRIATSTQYDSTSSNYKSSSKDQRGLVTNYNYGTDSGKLNHIAVPIGAMSGTDQYTTYYAYSWPTQHLTAVTNSANSSQLQYGYNKDSLTFMRIGTLSTFLQYNMAYDATDNLTSLSVQKNSAGTPQTLLNYSYDANDRLTGTKFANSGSVLSYGYDNQDRVVSVHWGDTPVSRFFYNSSGELGKTVSYGEGATNPVETYYDYDFADRLLGSYNTKGFGVRLVSYDKNNQGTGYTSYINNNKAAVNYETKYEYNNVDAETKLSVGAVGNLMDTTQFYDTMGRALTSRVICTLPSTGNNGIWTSNRYVNQDNANNDTTNLLQRYAIRYSSDSNSSQNPDYVYEYQYDRAGNVASAALTDKSGATSSLTYKYNTDGSLYVASAGANGSYSYSYDTRGNMLGKTQLIRLGQMPRYVNTGDHTYDDTKLDRLLTYTDKTYSPSSGAQTDQFVRTYTYDLLGNPTRISQANGMSSPTTTVTNLTWTQGRLLDTLSIGGGVSNTYRYNENDLLSKVIKSNGAYTEFFYDSNGTLEYEMRYNSGGTLTRMLKYFYDSNGDIRFLLSKSDNFKNQDAFNLYYYVKDGLGNITGLIRVKSQSGSATVQDKTLVAQYTYDPYGKIESVTRPSGISDDIYQINPIRYKSYYYDSDSGWYNLKTRYYDPVIARFINADDVSLIISSPQAFTDKNLYAYCDNDPINRSDGEGEWWHIAIGAFLGGAFEIASQLVEGNEKINWVAVGVAAGSGALSAATGTWAASVAASTAGSFLTEAVKGKSLKDSVCSAAFSGATAGFINGHVVTKVFGKQIKEIPDRSTKVKTKSFISWMKHKAIPASKAWIKRNRTKSWTKVSRTLVSHSFGGPGSIIYSGARPNRYR